MGNCCLCVKLQLQFQDNFKTITTSKITKSRMTCRILLQNLGSIQWDRSLLKRVYYWDRSWQWMKYSIFTSTAVDQKIRFLLLYPAGESYDRVTFCGLNSEWMFYLLASVIFGLFPRIWKLKSNTLRLRFTMVANSSLQVFSKITISFKAVEFFM